MRYMRFYDLILGTKDWDLKDELANNKKSRTRGYKTPVPVKGTGCDEMNIL